MASKKPNKKAECFIVKVVPGACTEMAKDASTQTENVNGGEGGGANVPAAMVEQATQTHGWNRAAREVGDRFVIANPTFHYHTESDTE